MEVSDDTSESDRNLVAKKLGFCGERSSVTLYKQKQKRNSTALQLLRENSEVVFPNDVSVSEEQIVVQRLSLKHKSIPIGCTETIENRRKHFNRRNVGNSLNLLIMMIDDSTTLLEGWIQYRVMEKLQNELFVTYLPRGQVTSMSKCHSV